MGSSAGAVGDPASSTVAFIRCRAGSAAAAPAARDFPGEGGAAAHREAGAAGGAQDPVAEARRGGSAASAAAGLRA